MDAPLFIALGLLVLVVSAGPPLVVFAWPHYKMRRTERRAAQGDPDAIADMQALERFGEALALGTGAKEHERERLLATGIPVRAEIVEVKHGMKVSRGVTDHLIVDVTLRLPERAEPLVLRDAVPEFHLGRLLRGATVPAFVDLADPDNVAVAWDAV